MGIYPDEQWKRSQDGNSVVRTYNNYSGVIVTEVYERVLVIEERVTCYCCTCDDTHTDPACRNHGGLAVRPCEIHEMPGEPYPDGVMPDSVLVRRNDMEKVRANLSSIRIV